MVAVIDHGVRPPGRSRPGALLALLLILLATSAAPARAQDFLEAYRAGVDAIERQDWTAAETLMTEAASGRPEAAQRLARFLYFKPYIPHYYLGLARLRQGDCAGALEAWEESERQGVVQAEADAWSVLTAERAECVRRRAEADEAAQVARELQNLLGRVDRGIAEAEDLAPRAQSAGVWRQGRPSPADRLESARQTVAEARRLVDEGAGEAGSGAIPAETVERVRGLAQSALSTLEALESQVDALEQQVVEQRGSERQRLEALQGRARRLLDETEDLAAEIPVVAQERGALAAALDASTAATGDAVPVDVLATARRQLSTAVETLSRVSQPPPAPLLEGADAYFSGELEQAVEMLSELDTDPAADGQEEPPRQRRARAHAALLRGAARFSLWQMGGAADIDLLEAARRDVRIAREADPELMPLPRAFSPRFLAFFEANPPEEAAPPAEDN